LWRVISRRYVHLCRLSPTLALASSPWRVCHRHHESPARRTLSGELAADARPPWCGEWRPVGCYRMRRPSCHRIMIESDVFRLEQRWLRALVLP
jgi:hypothetical protein